MSDRATTGGFKGHFVRLVGRLDEGADAVKERLAARFDSDDPFQILPYRGYGTRRRLMLQGRVLEDEPIGAASQQDSMWVNLANTWKRLESDEVPGARIRASHDGWTGEVVADHEGYFRLDFEPPEPPPEDRLWREVELELLHPPSPGGGPVRAVGEVMVPPATAELGVISDIDDTVIETGVTDRLALARTVFLGNAYTRLAFKGVAAFYQALHQGKSGSAGNPLFFVSGSPWNLYDLLAELMDLHQIPRGPLLLRDFGFDRDKLLKAGNHEHKLGLIRPLLALYPELPFVLIGDSGEHDPEIYLQVVRENPGRILAIYIRKAGDRAGRDEEVLEIARQVRDLGTAMLLLEDTEAAAVHAAENGWIRREKVEEVHEAKIADEQAPSPAEAIVEEVKGEARPG